MACHAIWIIEYTSNISSFDEWHFSVCNEEVCVNFFYDILVYSKDWHTHFQHLETTLSTLQQNHLYAKYSNVPLDCCKLLGHVVFASCVQMQPNKVSSILNWLEPTTIKKGLLIIMLPLHNLI